MAINGGVAWVTMKMEKTQEVDEYKTRVYFVDCISNCIYQYSDTATLVIDIYL